MSNELIGAIGILVMLLLMFLRMPLGAVMMATGFFGCVYIAGLDQGMYFLRSAAYTTANSYTLTVIPLFTLMGIFAAYAGLSNDGFFAVNKWLGHLKGGLAMATVGGCAAFAAVCGSSIATAVTMCKIALPEMKKYNYADELSMGTIASGGLLGFIIPPSNPMILYCYLTEVSIGRLFMAGVLPGILITILFVISIYISCKINPALASSGPKYSWKERFKSLYLIWGVLILFFLVMGGMYGGLFTPTEGGAIGAFGALLLGILKKRLTWKLFTASLMETVQLTGMILFLIMGSTVLNSFIALTEIPFGLSNFVSSLQISPVLVAAAILVIYFLVGFFMDVIAVVIITVPIFYPILVSLSIDPIWFGVLVILTIMMGNVSPPFGITVFAIGGLAPEVPLYTIFRGVWPYLYAMIVAMIILIIFPQISLWLPGIMMGK
jgi:C4-dicarboxylate transporter, DctM subunit